MKTPTEIKFKEKTAEYEDLYNKKGQMQMFVKYLRKEQLSTNVYGGFENVSMNIVLWNDYTKFRRVIGILSEYVTNATRESIAINLEKDIYNIDLLLIKLKGELATLADNLQKETL